MFASLLTAQEAVRNQRVTLPRYGGGNPVREAIMTCDRCGHEIQDPSRAIQRSGHNFCSEQCADAYQRDNNAKANAR